MIKIVSKKKNGLTYKLEVYGHAEFDEYGKDIVCAAVSSATSMTVNGLCEILKSDLETETKSGILKVYIKRPDDESEKFLKAYMLQMRNINSEFPKNIKVTEEEYNG